MIFNFAEFEIIESKTSHSWHFDSWDLGFKRPGPKLRFIELVGFPLIDLVISNAVVKRYQDIASFLFIIPVMVFCTVLLLLAMISFQLQNAIFQHLWIVSGQSKTVIGGEKWYFPMMNTVIKKNPICSRYIISNMSKIGLFYTFRLYLKILNVLGWKTKFGFSTRKTFGIILSGCPLWV